MGSIGIDLGSTNLKAALYDDAMKCVSQLSVPVQYQRDGGVVEFDAEAYFDSLCRLLAELKKPVAAERIGLTGQAESLVVLGRDGRPLMNAISWMDERSQEECGILKAEFSPEICEAVTGQMAVLSTWPATKILWLKRHRPEIFRNADTYMLLKDYVAWRMTGVMAADCSIATFSFYFDIYHKRYWGEMLRALGLNESQLPRLTEPCTELGGLCHEAANACGLPDGIRVNLGTLDHFAGMIGTGNIAPGGVSLSTGTVMALAAMAENARPCGIAMHYGFLPDTHVMLPVAESGGVSLEWFRRTCMPQTDYAAIDRALSERDLNKDLVFLPYLVGTNAPRFDSKAAGMFYGLRAEHDAFDMAAAVMKGVSFLLLENCESMKRAGAGIRRIVATGGGSKSDLWCQMQADITGLNVVRPVEKEAACLGAAMAAAVSAGVYSSYADCAEKTVRMERSFKPHANPDYDRQYRQYQLLYRAALAAAEL
jgi:xylulokinase